MLNDAVRFLLMLSVACGAITGTVCAAGPAEIVLSRRANIESDLVRLGDVATIRADDALSQDTLARIVLGPAPTRLATVSADLILDRLQSSGVNTAEVSIAGAARCELMRVQTATPAVSQVSYVAPAELDRAQQRLQSAVAMRLEKAFPTDGPFAVEVTLDRDAAAVVNSLAEPIQFHGGSADLTAPQYLQLSGLENVTFVARIRRVEKVAVAAVPLQRGIIVQASHLRFEPIDEPGVLDASLLVGQELTRPVAAGHVVRQNDVKKVILVHANQAVMVSAEYPGIRVRRVMKAKENGGVGDIVTCEPLEGDKKVVAIVTGPNMAKVAVSAAQGLSGGYTDGLGSIQFSEDASGGTTRSNALGAIQ